MIACTPAPPTRPADAFTVEDHAVLLGALGLDSVQVDGPKEYLRSTATPDGLPNGSWCEVDEAGASAAAVADYRRRNRDTVRIDTATATALGLVLVGSEGIRRAPERSALERQRVFHISRPGYDESGGLAIVTVGFGCGPLCGMTSMELLYRTGNSWRIARSLCQMIY